MRSVTDAPRLVFARTRAFDGRDARVRRDADPTRGAVHAAPPPAAAFIALIALRAQGEPLVTGGVLYPPAVGESRFRDEL